ncbi:hypothetical protein KCP77_01065 [Salmonella enterica subsp. enterica]|nr:hypothetical protein KCP77_01065 [Salmonella enterica subsp. enterica]
MQLAFLLVWLTIFVVFPWPFGFRRIRRRKGYRFRQISPAILACYGAFMAFGVAFEVPVAIVLLCWMGITTPEDLRKTAFISLRRGHSLWECCLRRQMFSRKRCCAIPMYCLFEIGVFTTLMLVSDGRATKITRPKPKKAEHTEDK